MILFSVNGFRRSGVSWTPRTTLREARFPGFRESACARQSGTIPPPLIFDSPDLGSGGGKAPQSKAFGPSSEPLSQIRFYPAVPEGPQITAGGASHRIASRNHPES